MGCAVRGMSFGTKGRCMMHWFCRIATESLFLASVLHSAALYHYIQNDLNASKINNVLWPTVIAFSCLFKNKGKNNLHQFQDHASRFDAFWLRFCYSASTEQSKAPACEGCIDTDTKRKERKHPQRYIYYWNFCLICSVILRYWNKEDICSKTFQTFTNQPKQKWNCAWCLVLVNRCACGPLTLKLPNDTKWQSIKLLAQIEDAVLMSKSINGKQWKKTHIVIQVYSTRHLLWFINIWVVYEKMVVAFQQCMEVFKKTEWPHTVHCTEALLRLYHRVNIQNNVQKLQAHAFQQHLTLYNMCPCMCSSIFLPSGQTK